VKTIMLPPFPDLSEGIAAELAEMIWLSDEALWRATEPTFMQKQQERLAELNHAVDVRSLSSDEVAEQQELLAAYEHSVLVLKDKTDEISTILKFRSLFFRHTVFNTLKTYRKMRFAMTSFIISRVPPPMDMIRLSR